MAAEKAVGGRRLVELEGSLTREAGSGVAGGAVVPDVAAEEAAGGVCNGVIKLVVGEAELAAVDSALPTIGPLGETAETGGEVEELCRQAGGTLESCLV